MVRMRRVCAWCNQDLNPGSEDNRADHPVTHGICQECAKELWGSSGGVPLGDFLSSLEVPTLLVGGDVRVELANAEALSLLERSQGEVAGYLGGEVLDCVNAELPGGCGQSELCPACTVRGTVTDSYRTGESHRRIPSVLTVRRQGKPVEFSFLLTTEKAGDRVLIQIEPAGEGEEREKPGPGTD